MNTTYTADLRKLSDDEIAQRYAIADESECAQLVAEMKRRDYKTRRTAIDKARWAAVYEEWAVAAHAEYLAAEAACCGNLVNKESVADVTDPFSLWTGSEAWAMRCATEELRDFWAIRPRITVSQFREAIRAARREERRQMEGE